LPNLRSLTTYCASPEPRSLPSTGITRLHQYYEPLRHPTAPGAFLTGLRLLDPSSTPWGFPCCLRFPLCTCCRHYPGAATGFLVCSIPRSYQPYPIGSAGRSAHRPFRGLLGVHSRCGLHTRAVTIFRDMHFPEGFNRFVPSTVAPVASGWSTCRVGLAPTGKRRLFTAHL
jgi:hypothetical protein